MISLDNKKFSVWFLSIVAAAYVSMAPAITHFSDEALIGDYSSCVFNSIAVSVSADEVADIEGQCREAFTQSSNSARLVWSDVGHCYDSQEPKAGNRLAALALFKACSEFFS